MNLYHTYHVYADGNWKTAWDEHANALLHGLKDELSFFGVGIVGNQKNRKNVRQVIEAFGATVIAEQETGWEQVTLEWVDEFSDNNDGYLLYAHTKGSAYPSRVSTPWRNKMTNNLVVNWRECVAFLDGGFDTVGTTWHPACEQFGPRPYWAGNFWWATTTFIQQLPPVGHTSRYDAEGWIGECPNPIKYHAFAPGPLSYT